VRVERDGVWGVTAEILMVLERVVVGALRFLGAGGVSDSSSVRGMELLGLVLGLVGARLRFRLRGGLGMSR
jgi:hypothetical protein